MAAIEEIIVVAICVAVGFTLPVVLKAATMDEVPLESTSSSGNNTDKPMRPIPQAATRRNKRRGGPITWLFRAVRDYIRSKRSQGA